MVPAYRRRRRRGAGVVLSCAAGRTVADPDVGRPADGRGTARCEQLRNVATCRGCTGVAVMPDVHFGKGATVGSVIAMRGAVSPGGGRRRHRLRHVRGADLADAPTTCPTTSRRLRVADRGRPSRWASACTTSRSTRRRLHGFRTARLGRRSGSGSTTLRRRRCSSGRSRADAADGHARRRQPLHRGLPRTTTRAGSG